MSHKSSLIKIIFLIIVINLISTSGYTVTGGIEKYDEINLKYVLTYDGEVQETNLDFTTQVNPNNLILGFYEGLLGMTVGEDKNIVVPPEKGYTQPGHTLEGKTLHFDVHINVIVSNNRGDDYVEPTQETSSDAKLLVAGSANSDSIISNIFGSPIFQAVIGILVVGVIYVKSIGK